MQHSVGISVGSFSSKYHALVYVRLHTNYWYVVPQVLASSWLAGLRAAAL